MNHFLNFKNYDAEFLNKVIDWSLIIKSNPSQFSEILKGKRLYMLFQKTSTRTALSFALGMTDLGGFYFSQNWQDSNFAVGEIEDEIRYVGRNSDIIMARLKLNEDLNLMADYSTVPIINGCCNKYHPCQAMADMLTIKEVFGNFNVKLLYIGVRNNILNSLMESLPKLGGELYSITPVINQPSVDDFIYQSALKTNRYHELDPNTSKKSLNEFIKDVDIVYTDSWVDMEMFNDKSFEKEKNERIARLMPFQIDSELLKGSKAIVMHDMPIHAGYEITREVVEKNIDIILKQAENRRHAQNGILVSFLAAEKMKNMINC